MTPWTNVAHQAPPSMGFSRQEYWSGLPFPSPGDPPDPGIEPRSPTLQADALTSEPPGKGHIKYTIPCFLGFGRLPALLLKSCYFIPFWSRHSEHGYIGDIGVGGMDRLLAQQIQHCPWEHRF